MTTSEGDDAGAHGNQSCLSVNPELLVCDQTLYGEKKKKEKHSQLHSWHSYQLLHQEQETVLFAAFPFIEMLHRSAVHRAQHQVQGLKPAQDSQSQALSEECAPSCVRR